VGACRPIDLSIDDRFSDRNPEQRAATDVRKPPAKALGDLPKRIKTQIAATFAQIDDLETFTTLAREYIFEGQDRKDICVYNAEVSHASVSLPNFTLSYFPAGCPCIWPRVSFTDLVTFRCSHCNLCTRFPSVTTCFSSSVIQIPQSLCPIVSPTAIFNGLLFSALSVWQDSYWIKFPCAEDKSRQKIY